MGRELFQEHRKEVLCMRKGLTVLNGHFDILEVKTECCICWNNDDGERHEYYQSGNFTGSLAKIYEKHKEEGFGEGMILSIVLGSDPLKFEAVYDKANQMINMPIAIKLKKHPGPIHTVRIHKFEGMSNKDYEAIKELKEGEAIVLELGSKWFLGEEGSGDHKYAVVRLIY